MEEEVAVRRQPLQTSLEERRSKSGEDGNSSGKRKGLPGSSSAASARKIVEIFGREEDDGFDNEGEVVEVGRVCDSEPRKKKKKQKRRSLEDIYRATKPMDSERYLKKVMISH